MITAANVAPPATTEPTTRASNPATLVDPERFETTSTTTAMGTVAMATRSNGAHVSAGARRPNHRWKTASARTAATL
jgi:hypothetical protein